MTGNDDDKKHHRWVIALAIILAIFVVVVIAIVFWPPRGKQRKPGSSLVSETAGTRSTYNPFHHALTGDWEMLETTPVLKEDKFVSSRIELPQYLVKEVPPGTVLRITAAHGRWKEVFILDENGSQTLFGWVDAEKAPGRQAVMKKPAAMPAESN